MPAAVCGIVPLVGPQGAVRFRFGKFRREPFGDVHVIVRVFVGQGGHFPKFRAAQTQHVFLFLGLRFGNNYDGTIAAGVADKRQADAGITRRALDNHPAGPEDTALFRIQDNVHGGAVLDGTAGVEKLGLAENRAPGFFGSLAQFYQRCVTDAAGQSVTNVHNIRLSLSEFCAKPVFRIKARCGCLSSI